MNKLLPHFKIYIIRKSSQPSQTQSGTASEYKQPQHIDQDMADWHSDVKNQY